MTTTRAFLWTALSALFAGMVSAQSEPLTCVANTGVSSLIRLEGAAELAGDIVISCTGGNAAEVRFVNLDIFMSAPVTSRATSTDGRETEALLLIDEPQPEVANISNGAAYSGQVKGTPGVAPGSPGSGNVYQGWRAGSATNRLNWTGIPIVPPGTGAQRVIRITNIRVDARELPKPDQNPAQLTAFLAASPQTALPVSNPRFVVGSALEGLEFSVLGAIGGNQNPKPTVDLIFRERFSTAFRKRIENDPSGFLSANRQAVPGAVYGTESGLTPDFSTLGPDGIGVAETGTRFVAHFANLPPGVILQAPSVADSFLPGVPPGVPGLLELRRVTGFDETYARGALATGPKIYTSVDIVDGKADLVYEVVAISPYEGISGAGKLEEFQVPVLLQGTLCNPCTASATVSASFAPVAPADAPVPDSPPRFSSDSSGGGEVPIVAPPALRSLKFVWAIGDPAPLRQLVTVDPQGRALTTSFKAFTRDGGAWLSFVAPASPTTAAIEVVVNPVGLATGDYSGSIAWELTTGDTGSLLVTLRVRPEPQWVVDTSPVVFQHLLGGPDPPPVVRSLNPQYASLAFSVRTATDSGGHWLSVRAVLGKDFADLVIRANPEGLGVGTYRGTVTVTSTGAVTSPNVIPVELTIVDSGPLISSSGIVNAASYAVGPVAPGEMVVLFGIGIGPEQIARLRLDAEGKVATELADTQILFDGVAAPLIYVSSLQSAAIAPYAVAGKDTTQIEVEYAGKRSAPVTMNVAESAPGIFATQMTGSGQGAILNEDSTPNWRMNPAERNSVVQIFATGEGETDPPGVDGKIATEAEGLPTPVLPVKVTIGGLDAEVTFKGTPSGMVAGFLQVNARVPEGVTPGDAVPVEIMIGDRRSQPGITLAVK